MNESFAQAWVNKTGGKTIAMYGKTDYYHIMFPVGWSIQTKKGMKIRHEVKAERNEFGFSPTGSWNYPEPWGKKAYWRQFLSGG